MPRDLHPPSPVIRCNDGTQIENIEFGRLKLHDLANTSGVQQIIAPECSIFLVCTPVTVTDVWEGERQRQHTYEAGSLSFLPSGTEVRSDYVSNTYTETMVRMPCDILERVAGDVINQDALDIRYRPIAGKHTLGITATVRRIAMAEVDSPVMPLLVESMTVSLAAGIICSLSASAQTTMESLPCGLSERRKRMALEYIEANLSRDVTLAEIAAAAALSPYHFARSFKAAMGMTPVRYVWARRLEQAKRLLLDPALPLVDVAESCGFSSQSSFTTAFRQATGKTPAAWRRSAI